MPTMKILVGEKLVDAEIVVREGALFAKVPDEYIGSSMPLMTAKLQAQVEAVGMLLSVGDSVHAAEENFPRHYPEKGKERAQALRTEYQLCREIYEAGKYDVAKQRLSSLKGKLEFEMVSFELAKLVKDELTANPESSKKVKVEKKDGEEVFSMAARFDGARLEAKLFGAKFTEPVGELLPLPEISSGVSLQFTGDCSCDCPLPSASSPSYCGWLETVRRFTYGSLVCQAQQSHGSLTSNFETTDCSILGPQGKECEKMRRWYYPTGSS
jgi:hypothetical protein